MRIRKAKKEDMQEIARVEMSSGYHKNKFDFIPYVEKLFRLKNIIYCAEQEKSIVGYISYNKNGEISFFSVREKMHNKGIGTQLLNKVIDHAIKNRIKRLFLDVRNDNISAIILYIKNGFIITNIFKKKINGKSIIKLQMEKKLKLCV